jgi:Putative sensor
MNETPSAIDRVFGAVLERQTYRNMAYLLLSFPLGIAYFVLLIAGLSTGLSLLIVLVGVPILVGVLALTGRLLNFERWLLRAMLGAAIEPQASARPNGSGLARRLAARVSEPATWKGLLYLLLRFPMGIASFVIVVTLVPLSLAMLTVPLTYTFIPVQAFDVPIHTFDQAIFFCSAGAILSLITVHLVNAGTAAWRNVSKLLLS